MESVPDLQPPNIAEVEAYQNALREIQIQEGIQQRAKSQNAFTASVSVQPFDITAQELMPLASHSFSDSFAFDSGKINCSSLESTWISPALRHLPSVSADVRPQILHIVICS